MNVQDEEGKTALHYAIERCDVSCEVLSCLIKNGANVNAYSNDGYTPLMKAIIRIPGTIYGQVFSVSFRVSRLQGLQGLQIRN